MKKRTGFVSNSSSSSFICKMPNFENLSEDDRVHVDILDEIISDEKFFLKHTDDADPSELRKCESFLEDLKKAAKEKNCVFFDITIDNESYDTFKDIAEKLMTYIPHFECEEFESVLENFGRQ